MTEQEAIEIIKSNFPKTCKMINGRLKGGFDDTDCDFGKALLIAISALEEIQQYRALGSVQFIKDELSNYDYLIQSQRLNAESDINELNEYRALGTVEQIEPYLRLAEKLNICDLVRENASVNNKLKFMEIELREAKEKQKAKKPVTYPDTNRADCPICGSTVRGIGKPFGNYCSNCGQAIDWS